MKWMQGMDEKIEKYINNNCNKEEFIEVVTYLEKNEGGQFPETFLRKYWEGGLKKGDQKSKVRLDNVLNKIHHDINIKESEYAMKAGLGKKSFIRVLQKVAAILLLPLLITSIYFGFDDLKGGHTEQFITAYSPHGQYSKIILSDGTEVWLNERSKLTYSTRFGRKHRDVKLEGEGYFKVTKNRKIPFKVFSKGLEVKVLGTHFNVEAYSEMKHVAVTLEEGAVEITKQKKLVRLAPGEQAIIGDEGDIVKQRVKTEVFTSWHTGELIFNNSTLAEVAAQFEKLYGVRIHFLEDDLKEKSLYGRFRTEKTIYHSLEILKESVGVEYEVHDKDVYLKNKGMGKMRK